MHPYFDDITSRIDEPPKWYWRNGVPRYCDFHPRECGVYSDVVVLLEIECQRCGAIFKTSVECASFEEKPEFDDLGRFHYGDPPGHGCVGDTMGSITVRILEFWTKDESRQLVRRPEFEVRVDKWEESN